ncbi:MAG: hypothetical protein V3R41_03390 [Gammaproteobacteria bacterium]
MMRELIEQVVVSGFLLAILLSSGILTLAWFNLFHQPEWMEKVKRKIRGNNDSRT